MKRSTGNWPHLAGFTKTIVFATCLWGVTTIGSSWAEEAPYERRISIVSTALSDELLETVSTTDVSIRSEAAFAAFGQVVLSVNEHFTDMRILEAATIKSDGRRVDVPADKILVASLPNSTMFGIFEADVRTRTIVFPDVAVGDTLHYKIIGRDLRRGISGGFSAMYAFAPSMRFRDVNIELNVPKTLNVHESSRGFARAAEERDDRRVISWKIDPQTYRADEPGATAPIDRDPYLTFSSYSDWQAIGQKFFDGARPTSEPTAELRALADEITKNVPDRRAQAVAIYDWVSTNIRYFSIFLGQGGFVPHDAITVLKNKYGDCKDHVTLMRALLGAKGISADYALISSLPIYQELKVPTPDWFNHVILWLPEFGQYVDPTASSGSFVSLPDSEADKTVLRIGDDAIAIARTPALSADSNHVTIASDVTLSPSGEARGQSTITASGAASVKLREMMKQVSLKGGDVVAQELLSRANWRGNGSIEKRSPTDHSEPFVVRTSFDLSNRFLDDGSNRNAVPIGPRMTTPAWLQFERVLKERRTEDFVCQSETYEQVIDFHLPEGLTLTNTPADIKIEADLASFEARHSLAGQTLNIQRKIVIRVPGQSCPPRIAKDLEAVMDDAEKEFNWRPQFRREISRNRTSDQRGD